MSEPQDWGYENPEPTLRDILNLLRRRRWVLFSTFALCLGLAVIITPRMTTVYRAQATMLMEASPERGAPAAGEGGPFQGLLQPAQPHAPDTQVEVLQSSPLRKKVIQRLGRIPPDAYPSLEVEQVGQTDVLQVAAESTNPRVARDAANLLVDQYIRQSEEISLRAIRRTRAFVEQKLAEAQNELLRADTRMRQFKEQHRLPDVDRDLASATDLANSIEEERRKATNEFNALQSQIQQLREQIAHEPLRVQQSESRVLNPEVTSLEAEIDRLEMQRITHLRTLRPTEPEVREVDTQIARLRRKLKKLPAVVRNGWEWQLNPARAALQGRLAELETKARGLEPELVGLQKQHDQAMGRLRTFPALQARLSGLALDRERAQENQMALSKQLRDLRIREQARENFAQVLSPASLPHIPIRPQPVRNLLVAAVLGLVFGVGAACLREMTDDRLHTAEEAERLVDLPVLGRVPSFDRRAPALIAADGDSSAKESYRRLRAGISFAAGAEAIQSLMVTSARPREGKSTTAANLAVVAALSGRRVVLVDADLRDPSLAALFRLPAVPGLSDVLSGTVTLPEAMQPTGTRDLLLLPAGTPVSDAAELLAGPRLSAVLEELNSLADLVIIDTPPCLPVADAEVIGSCVDSAVLVVGLSRTDRVSVRMARALLDQARVRVIGAVMNGIRPGDLGYYRYSYGHRGARKSTTGTAGSDTMGVLPLQSGGGATTGGEEVQL
jgi:polysaccharide biosynthesis transport protein